MSYIRQRGAGDYENSGNWTWEHWPPPFDQWAPTDSAVQPSPVLGGGGLGCASCGGGCGGSDPSGLGQTSSGGLFGTGLFTSLNPTTWGVGEWGIVGITFLVVSSHPAVSKRSKKVSQGGMGIGTVAVLGAAAYGAWWLSQNYAITATGTSGVGDYQQQGWVTPQVLTSPGKNSQLLIPVGW